MLHDVVLLLGFEGGDVSLPGKDIGSIGRLPKRGGQFPWTGTSFSRILHGRHFDECVRSRSRRPCSVPLAPTPASHMEMPVLDCDEGFGGSEARKDYLVHHLSVRFFRQARLLPRSSTRVDLKARPLLWVAVRSNFA